MVCHPGYIPTALSHHAYTQRVTGIGPSFPERQRERIPCPHCGRLLTRGALRTHSHRVHGSDLTTTPDPSPLPHVRHHYQSNFPSRPLSPIPCPVPQCPGTFRTRDGLRTHFNTRLPHDDLCIQQEGSTPLPRCPKCHLLVSYKALNGRHPSSAKCQRATSTCE